MTRSQLIPIARPFAFAFAAALALSMLPGLLQNAFAQTTYPTKPVTVIVPFPPGGVIDTVVRILQPRLTERLGQPVLIDNRAGASGQIGSALTAKAAPDGHTLMLTIENHVVNQVANSKLSYDITRDFAPVSLLLRNPNVLASPAALRAGSLRELVEMAKASPGKLNYASPGFGTAVYLLSELFVRRADIRLVHIPYKGGAQIMQALMANEAQFSLLSYPLLRTMISSGDVKALAVTSAKRIPELPDVPTMAEAGFPEFVAYSWYGAFVPAGTPGPAINRLHAELSSAIAVPEIRARLAAAGLEPVGSSPQEFGAFVKSELDLWVKFSAENRIRFE